MRSRLPSAPWPRRAQAAGRSRPASRGARGTVAIGILLALATIVPPAVAQTGGDDRRVTLVVRDAEVAEVLSMLSRTENVSIAASEEVDGKVSISLFEVPIEEAIRAVAQAAGYAAERRGDAWVIVEFDDVGEDVATGVTEVRSYVVHYGDPEKVREILQKHLSRYGEITALPERRMVVVEDLPDFLDRVGRILLEIDRRPRQILLEAKVLEIALDKDDALGIDWSRMSMVEGTDLTIGVQGLTSGTAPGLFFDVLNNELEGAVEALTEEGRVRALATPQLLTVENQEAEVLVGERLGFRVTTTINQVTTESVEFIDSGVILRFTPSVDRDGRILLDIHPEVSTGTITNGIPSVTTTEVTTQLLTGDGEPVFIGGLIRDSASRNRRGVPFLVRIPWLGALFGRNEWQFRSTETIVIVKATIHDDDDARRRDRALSNRVDGLEPHFQERREDIDEALGSPAEPAAPAP